MDYRGHRAILFVIGILLLLVGIVAAFFGPVEMYCFYLFSEGGPFHYEGFGFGSFMFGNLATQIMGYYFIALLAIPLGYGHLKVRRWARTLALTLLWSWLVVGVPLAIIFFLILVTAKELSLVAVLFAVVLLGLSYPIIPVLLIRFYQSNDVKRTFESRDHNVYWTEELPVANLVLSFLYLFYAVVLHLPIFFNGIFPLFGMFLLGLEGIVSLTISILVLPLLIWGTLRQQLWAWWGALLYFGLLACSTILTFAATSFPDILARMRFPPTEMEILQGIPLQGVHLAVFFGFPLLLTLVAVAVSKRHFGGPARHHARPLGRAS
jgi:hypothetical protein